MAMRTRSTYDASAGAGAGAGAAEYAVPEGDYVQPAIVGALVQTTSTEVRCKAVLWLWQQLKLTLGQTTHTTWNQHPSVAIATRSK